jgi:hypothetical protein
MSWGFVLLLFISGRELGILHKLHTPPEQVHVELLEASSGNGDEAL